jgi:transcription initiation factor TFIIIB Brf1 subunit/transcription initiation factor TFIIB
VSAPHRTAQNAAPRATNPWRYVCPSCGTTNWRWRATKSHYHCKTCSTTFDHIHDKKTDGPARIGVPCDDTDTDRSPRDTLTDLARSAAETLALPRSVRDAARTIAAVAGPVAHERSRSTDGPAASMAATAGGSVYLAVRVSDANWSQREVADALGVGQSAIATAYRRVNAAAVACTGALATHDPPLDGQRIGRIVMLGTPEYRRWRASDGE